MQVHRPAGASEWLLQPNNIFRVGMLLLLCLYLRTITFDFVYDDLLIPLSPWIQSWHGVLDSFHSEVFGNGGSAQTSYYRPLAGALTVVVARLTAVSPSWFHLVSIVVDLGIYVLAFLFGCLFFEDETVAAFTALLYAVHPVRVETTAWIGSALCDGQAAIYFFASLICYLQWWKRRTPPWIATSVVLFLAAIFTKETMIVLPVLVAIHCLSHSEAGKRLRNTSRLMLPYAFSAALYLAARHAVLKPIAGSTNVVQAQFTIVNAWSAPLAFWWYVKRLVFPSGLSILYDSIVVRQPSLLRFVLPLIAAALLLILGIWAWYRNRSWRFVFLAAWFVLTLGPPIAFSPEVTVHDRYLQLAVYPFCALLVVGILAVGRHRSNWRWVSAFALMLVAAAWSLSTWHESGFWDNSVSLWRRAVQIAPHNINARVELARLYAANNVPEAIRELDDGLRFSPNSPGLWRTRGLFLFNAGDYDQARTSLQKALDVSALYGTDPAGVPADVKFGKATAAFYLGQIEMVRGDAKAADPWLRMATAIDPDNLDYQRGMVANLRKEGLNDEADRQQKVVDQLILATTNKK